VRIALPVFDDSAEVVYHSEQRSTKRVVAAPGNDKASDGSGTARWGARVDNGTKELDNGQYLATSFRRLDSFPGLIEYVDWNGRAADFELASQALPPVLDASQSAHLYYCKDSTLAGDGYSRSWEVAWW